MVESPDLGQPLRPFAPPAPNVVLATIVLLVATGSLALGVHRHGRRFLVETPGLLAVAFVAAWVLAASVTVLATFTVWSASMLALSLVVAQWFRIPRMAAPSTEGVRESLVLVPTVLGLATFLVLNLGHYSGAMMVWEPSVLDGFFEAIRAGIGMLRFTLRQLLWSEGLVSRGDQSFLYGSLTYALLHLFGASRVTLRIGAAVLACLCVPALHLALRRRLGTVAAAGAALALATGAPLVFYGRYGTSLSGTLLGAILALWATWRFLDRGSDWAAGLVCGTMLFLATLGYSPARPVVVALLASTVVSLLVRSRSFRWRQAAGVAALGGVLVAGIALQVAAGTTRYFLSARGEQVLAFFHHRDYLRSLLGREVRPEQLTGADRAAVVVGVLRHTLPELGALAALPLIARTTGTDTVGTDPPRLPYAWAPLLPVLLWGLGVSLRRGLEPEHLTLLAWGAAAIVPALLTTRFDAHRALLVVVPLAVWTGLGLADAATCLARAGIAPRWRAAAFALVVVGSGWCAADSITLREKPSFPYGPALQEEIASLPGRIILAADLDHREVGEATLALVQRTLDEGSDAGGPLEGSLLRPIIQRPSAEATWLAPLLLRIRGATLLVAPAEQLAGVAIGLQRSGACVVERGPEGARFWRVTYPPTGPCPGSAVPVEPDPPPPTASEVVDAAEVPSVSLTSLAPLATAYSFAAPRIDEAWVGGPITVAGIPYARGIGMHAWCRMEWPVPHGAVLFQAVVGLDHSATECAHGLVTFEVWAGSGEVLWTSGPIDARSQPTVVRVPVRDLQKLALVATEAGNGRDCDHADWAEPTFLLAKLGDPALPPAGANP